MNLFLSDMMQVELKEQTWKVQQSHTMPNCSTGRLPIASLCIVIDITIQSDAMGKKREPKVKSYSSLHTLKIIMVFVPFERLFFKFSKNMNQVLF